MVLNKLKMVPNVVSAGLLTGYLDLSFL